jgi:hypothetical protein
MKPNVPQMAVLMAITSIATVLADSTGSGPQFLRNKLALRFNSSALAYHRMLDCRSAVRTELSFSGNTGSDRSLVDSDQMTVNYTEGNSSDEQGNGNSQSIGLTVQYLRYLSERKSVSFYLATGPSASWSRNESEDKETNRSYQLFPDTDSDTSSYRSDSSSLRKALGATVTLGAEIALSRRIGVYGTYEFRYSYFWRSSDHQSVNIRDMDRQRNGSHTSQEGWSIDWGGFMFGAYFLF